MLQDLSTYGCTTDQKLGLSSTCAKNMDLIAKWEIDDRALYLKNKNLLEEGLNDIVGMVAEASKISGKRIERFRQPLIF